MNDAQFHFNAKTGARVHVLHVLRYHHYFYVIIYSLLQLLFFLSHSVAALTIYHPPRDVYDVHPANGPLQAGPRTRVHACALICFEDSRNIARVAGNDVVDSDCLVLHPTQHVFHHPAVEVIHRYVYGNLAHFLRVPHFNLSCIDRGWDTNPELVWDHRMGVKRPHANPARWKGDGQFHSFTSYMRSRREPSIALDGNDSMCHLTDNSFKQSLNALIYPWNRTSNY